MLLHSLARGRADDVAACDPPRAADRIDMQSVFIRRGLGHIASTKSIAHSSAAAAVAMRVGGVPYPYPSNFPSAATTTIPNPVQRSGFHCPQTKLPSVYHVGSLMSSAGVLAIRSFSHLNVP